MKLLLLLLACLSGGVTNGQLTFSLEAPSSDPESCTTPDSLEGTCVELPTCVPLLNLFKRRPIPAPIITHLRKSVCRYARPAPYVCCPSLKPSRARTTPATTTTTTTTSTKSSSTTTIGSTSSSSTTSSTTESTPEPPKVYSLPKEGECGVSTTAHTRIVGGYPSEIHAWPWIAALGFYVRFESVSSRKKLK